MSEKCTQRMDASRTARQTSLVLLLVAATLGACGEGGQPEQAAGADDFANRLGLGGQAEPSSLPTMVKTTPAQSRTPRPAAFTPRDDIVAAVEANRRQRKIPSDNSLPRATARNEAELAAQTRAELEEALKETSIQ